MDFASLGIKIDSSQAKTGAADLDKLTAAGAKSERELNSLGSTAKNVATSIGSLKAAVGALGVGLGGAQIISQIDSYTKLTSQLKLASTGASDYANSLNDVRRISKEAQSDLTATAVLYARIANGTRELGIGQKSVANITETVNLALKVSGATASEASSAMLQLSQAFGSGKLNGEEFNAVNEAAPRLMKALADGMGVPIGALKEMATNGQITAEVMSRVLPKALGELREEAKYVQSIGGSFTVLKNNALEFVGVGAQSSGAVRVLSGTIETLANNINVMASAATGFVAVKLAQSLVSITTSAYATVAANQAQTAATLATAKAQVTATGTASALAAARVLELRGAVLASEGAVALAVATNGLIPAQARAAVAAEAHAVALVSLSVAQRAASIGGAAASSAMTLLGGPIGLVTTLLGLGVTAWSLWGRSSENASNQAAGAVAATSGEIIANIEKQNVKLRERVALLKAGQPELAKTGGAESEVAAAALTKVNALKAKGASITAVEQIALIEQQGIINDITNSTKTRAGLQGEIDNIGKQSKAAEWMDKLATKTEKLNKELKTAKAELGAAFSPEIEKRIRDKYEEKGASKGGGGAKVEKLSEYTQISDAIAKVNTLQTLELEGGGKLAASERFRFDEMAKIEAAYKIRKISDVERIRLTAELTAATAKFQQVEKRDATAKSNAAEYVAGQEIKEELRKADEAFLANRADGLVVVKDYAAAIQAENEFTQFQLSLAGKSEAAQKTEIELYKIKIGLEKQLADIKTRFALDAKGGEEAAAEARKAAEKARAGVPLRGQLDATNTVAGYIAGQKSPRIKEIEENDKRLKEIDLAKFESVAERNDAIEKEAKRHKDALAAIESQAAETALNQTVALGDQIYQLLVQSGKEKTALGKALFLTNKAMAVANIIVKTEEAAAEAMVSGGTFAGIPLAAIIRATGYASAGIVAGTAIASVTGGKASGGRVEPNSLYRVNERGPEALTVGGQDFLMMGDQGGVVTPNNKLGGGDGNITIVNNTSAKIGKVVEQRMPNGDRALIVQEAVEAMVSQFSDPNSRGSRGISRYFAVQRNR